MTILKLALSTVVYPLVGRQILLVFPLYCVQRLVTDRLIEIGIFGRSERFVCPTNDASQWRIFGGGPEKKEGGGGEKRKKKKKKKKGEREGLKK